MLDSNDLQAIAALLAQQKLDLLGVMAQQKKEIVEEMDLKLARQKKEIVEEMDLKLARQKKEIMRDVEILMENVFQPQFNLLSEKLDAALEKLAPSEALMAVEDRVGALEEVTALHSTEIEALKKAQ
ncbi:MAG: hypothetical protein HFF90_09785 [Oscillibacter sp.]|nr:hypothetical protein [Oscillibacter sp.]